VRRARTAAAGVLLAAALTALTACGIRPTSVPVDAGVAPSRAECGAENRSTPSPQASKGEEPHDVYLVCGPQIAAVPRSMPLTGTSGREAHRKDAAVLLDELQRSPGPKEQADGYTTAVSGLRTAPAHAGDPVGAVRFSKPPDELGDPALAQLVCTYAGMDATVRLGGPHDPALTSYTCDLRVLAEPDSVREHMTP
jgi:hypothetical protein